MAERASTRVRLDADDRRRRLRSAARKVFARRGYAGATMADVAKSADVSKALLYHYFPEGRPEIYAAVMDDLADDLLGAIRPPSGLRGNREQRLTRFAHELVRWFDRNRDAHALLVREPPGTGEPRLQARAAGLRASLVRHLAPIVVGGAGSETVVAATSGSVGFVLEVVEGMLARQVDAADAEACIVAFVLGGMERVEGLATTGGRASPAGDDTP